jgi:hypothetical protein
MAHSRRRQLVSNVQVLRDGAAVRQGGSGYQKQMKEHGKPFAASALSWGAPTFFEACR